MKRLILGVLIAAGCGGADDRPAPSCSQSFMHYYASGCSYIDLTTGQTIPVGQTIATCQSAVASGLSAQCSARLDDWLTCGASVPDHSTTAADCDCSSDLQAYLACR